VSAKDVIELRAPEIYAEYTADDNDRLTPLIELAEPYLNLVEEAYEPVRDQGLAFLVLHWITLLDRGGASGVVTEEKEGDLSRKYALPVGVVHTDYSSTSWGIEFVGIRRKIALLPAPEEEEA
jgi:hypothetical protein